MTLENKKSVIPESITDMDSRMRGNYKNIFL